MGCMNRIDSQCTEIEDCRKSSVYYFGEVFEWGMTQYRTGLGGGKQNGRAQKTDDTTLTRLEDPCIHDLRGSSTQYLHHRSERIVCHSTIPPFFRHDDAPSESEPARACAEGVVHNQLKGLILIVWFDKYRNDCGL